MILLIDDDEELRDLMTDYLSKQGFTVECAGSGTEGLRKISNQPELVLLDIMLPDMDGFAVLTELRKTSRVPVIMLTARGEEIDRIVGLEMGADDYLPKPFNPRELSARIKAVLRRVESTAEATNTPDEKLTFGALKIDPAAHRAFMGDRELELTAIEFALLMELARSSGRVLSRDTLLDRVRGREYEIFDRSIDVHVSHLRQKLGDNPREPQFIKTVRMVGYLFVSPSG